MTKERYNQIIDDVYNNFLMISKKRVSKEMIEKFVKNTPKVEFINKIKTDERFSKYWGLKIEERELSLDERSVIAGSNHNEVSQNIKMLFELKPCNECSHTCVEGEVGVKCPFDIMVENLIIDEDE